MKEHENDIPAEESYSRAEQRVVQDIFTLSQAYARENERSLERIWGRFAQSQQDQARQMNQQGQQQEPGSRRPVIEGKGMQEKDISQEPGFATLYSQPVRLPRRKGRPIGRIVSISGAVAVVLLMVLSWVLLSNALRQNSTHSITTHQTTQTGSAQKVIHSGTLLCNFPDDNSEIVFPQQPTLDWSVQGQIAATYANLKTFSAQSCTHASADLLTMTYQANWSPDGKRLLVLTGLSGAQVLDASTGRTIAALKQHLPGDFVGASVWSANGTQVISEVITYPTKTTAHVSVVVWNASNGAVVSRLLTVTSNIQIPGLSENMTPLSPDGRYLAVETNTNTIDIWDIASGKRVSSIPFGITPPSVMDWTPDGASLALGLPNASTVQVWNVATGKLLATFSDSDTSLKLVGALVWSPNGRYLAESTTVIHIWDAQTRKVVATFGKGDTEHEVVALAWSPDSAMLAASTVYLAHTQNTVSIWKLR